MQKTAQSHEQLEVALQQNEARLRRLVANIPGVIYQFRLHPNGSVDFPYISDNCFDLLEVEPSALKHDATALISMIEPHDRVEFERSISQSAMTLQLWEWEGRFLLPSRQTRWIRAASCPEQQVNGEILWDGLLTDISDAKHREAERVRIENERKQAELALQRSKDLLDAIINNSPTVIYLKDLQGRYLIANREYANLFGMQTEQIIGKTDREIHSLEIADAFRANDLEALSVKTFLEREEVAVTPEGIRTFLSVKFPLLDATGEPYATCGISTEISDRARAEAERKQAEAALRQSKDQLDAIINNSPAAIFLKDLEGRYLIANQKCLCLFNMTADEFTGRTDYDLFPTEIADGFRATDLAVLAAKTFVEREEVALTPNGMQTFMAIKFPLLDATGVPYALCGISTDISDRKQAEQALQQKTSELEAIFEALPDLYFRMNLAGVVLDYKAAATSELYIQPEVFINQRMADLLPPAASNFIVDAIAQLQHTQSLVSVEYELPMPSGSQSYEARLLPLGTDQIIAIVRNITDAKHREAERKQTQAALQKQEQFLRSVYDGVEHLIFVIDVLNNKEFQYASWNFTAEQITGLSASDIAGKTPQEVFGATEGTTYCEKYASCIMTGASVTYEETARFKNGEQWFLTTLNPLKDSNGTIYRLIGTAIEITERKQAEEALRQKAQQEQLFNQLASQIRASLDIDRILETAVHSIRELLHTDRCNFVWHRPRATPPTWESTHEAKIANLPSVLGLYPTDLLGSTAEKLLNLEILRDDDVRAAADPMWRQLLINLEFKSSIAIPILTSTGNIGVIACTHQADFRPWKDSEVELLKSVANQLAIALNQADLYKQSRLAAQTAQAQAQQLEHTLQELQRTQAKLVQNEKMSGLGQLVAGVAHEINNPVNFIHGNLTYVREYTQDLLRMIDLYQQHSIPNSMIQAEAEKIDLEFLIQDLPKLLNSMKVGTDRISEIVLALRNFSRMDEAELKAVNIHDGIDNTLLILQHRLKNKSEHSGIEVIKQYGTLPLVECYAGQLNQVFMNILTNAIDALEERDQQRTLADIKRNPSQICIMTDVGSSSISIRIADNGVGISEAVQQRLFDPFFTTKPVGKGTGLGMSISHQIITEKHQGSLRCDSALGQGTEFTIQIPLKLNQQ